MALRASYRTEFENTHQVRLGFMGMFVQASVMALREFPAVNAEIDGNDIIYKNYYNIGVAVGTPQGLVVPVIKGAEAMNLAEVERTIGDFGARARDGKIAPDDMAGGTFTISNGGVYGSLMSTPILNPPQSGILGMHKIEKRAVVVDDAIVIRPMMYLALSYDHRIIDGREAVSFLARVKDLVEDPRRLLIGV
jgi:2-oxoglutarate dehydrogenase E2 component (dihydrolipoamide succinyltransferase)